jgi:putative ABC transport system ATP-binding protein
VAVDSARRISDGPSVRTAPLDATDLYRFYHSGDDEVLALRGVSIHADAGEIVAVVGPSGSGKSTLLACLAGLDEPDGGAVRICGERLSRRSEAERAGIRRQHIGVLLQAGNLVEHLSIADNIRLAQTLSAGERRPVDDVLAAVGLESRAGASPSQLSGGEAARAGLAVALSTQPAVLLADEPTGEVDSETEHLIVEMLKAEAAAGMAVLVATHSEHMARAAARVVRLHDGVVVDA